MSAPPTLVDDSFTLSDALENTLEALRQRPDTVATIVVLRVLCTTLAREAVLRDVSLNKLESLVRHEYYLHAAAAGQP
jgi:hypothetical protein